MKNFKILGQEPAALVGIVEAALLMLLTFGVPGLDQDTVGVIVAAVAAALGFVTAYATRTTLYSALVGLAKAVLVLAVTFGAPLTDAQTGSILAVIMLVASAYLREKTSSIDTVLSTSSVGANPDEVALVPLPPTDDELTSANSYREGNQDTL